MQSPIPLATPRLRCLLLAAVFAAATAHAQQPTFDPSKLKGPAKGTPNELVVLGTAHLRYLPATFQPASLSLLTERLIAWKPRIIATENVSGPQCAFMREHPDRYRDSVKSFCPWDPEPARAATGLDVPAATAEIHRLLAHWPSAPTPSQRRHLAAVFLAGGEPVSALVQWLRLPEAERHAGDGVDANLAETLRHRRIGRGERGEDTLIAAPLAAALGLERVYSMDDHTADAYEVEEGYDEAIGKAWNNPASARRRQMDKDFEARLGEAEGVLALYRALNDPAQASLIYASDFGAALEEPSPQQFGRGYVASWETRNLRMASNIREAVGTLPGSRTLVIVGASHKWYIEAYLNQMHDVRIVSSEHLLN